MKTILSLPVLLAISSLSIGPAQAKHPENIEEALKCMVYVRSYDDKGKPLADGSGFIAEENGVQWLYTNAHVIDGAKKIVFKDSTMKTITGFTNFQCYSLKDGNTNFGGKAAGADGVRVQLKTKRSLAFQTPSSLPHIAVADEVITLGDNRGKKKMDILPGTVTAIHTSVFITNCKSEPGSSGGILLKKDGLLPIGLNTWVFTIARKPLDGVWARERLKFEAATKLHGVTWISMPASDFLAGRKKAMQLIKSVQVLSLIYQLVPSESGFTYKENDRFAGGYTVKEAIDHLAGDPIFSPILVMQNKLNGRGRGKIGVNKMELCRMFQKAIKDSRRNYRRRIKKLNKDYAPYYQISLQTRGVIQVGGWCDKNLETAQTWFESKTRTGGTLPLGRWYGKYGFDELIWE